MACFNARLGLQAVVVEPLGDAVAGSVAAAELRDPGDPRLPAVRRRLEETCPGHAAASAAAAAAAASEASLAADVAAFSAATALAECA